MLAFLVAVAFAWLGGAAFAVVNAFAVAVAFALVGGAIFAIALIFAVAVAFALMGGTTVVVAFDLGGATFNKVCTYLLGEACTKYTGAMALR